MSIAVSHDRADDDRHRQMSSMIKNLHPGYRTEVVSDSCRRTAAGFRSPSGPGFAGPYRDLLSSCADDAVPEQAVGDREDNRVDEQDDKKEHDRIQIDVS